MTKPIATIINSNGESKEIKPKGLKFTLKELKEYLGADIEIISTINDDARLIIHKNMKGRKLNVGASLTQNIYQFIVGNAIFINNQKTFN